MSEPVQQVTKQIAPQVIGGVAAEASVREDDICAILGEEADIDFDARRIDYGDAIKRIAALSIPQALPVSEADLVEWLYTVTSMESHSDCRRLAYVILSTYTLSRPHGECGK